MEGKNFPEIGNRPFISLSIFIQDSLENIKKFGSAQVMRYIRLDKNGININYIRISFWKMQHIEDSRANFDS